MTSQEILDVNGALATGLMHNQADDTDRTSEIYRVKRDPETYEVTIESDVTIEEILGRLDPEVQTLLKEFAEPMRGKTVTFVNPTMTGGGVAMMRPTLVHTLRELGVDARWYVMKGKDNPDDPNEPDPFEFTKKMHVISHRLGGDARIDQSGKDLHQSWVNKNAEILLQQEGFLHADFVVIDDPQPVPLIPLLKQVNPGVSIIWRNHIDTDYNLMADPTTPQGEIASYLLDECDVRSAAAVVAHPIEAFIHPGMEDKTYFAPATIDLFDNLNRHLTEEEIVRGIDFVNAEIALHNAAMIDKGRMADVMQLLDTDPTRKRITLIARFDEAKGMDKAMKMGHAVRHKMRAAGVAETDIPEVVIVGNGSIDDPSGKPMFEKMLQLRREEYADDADGIILMRLNHNYDAMNALVNRSSILMQTSDAEGLETRISDAISHGKPVVISNRGGMKRQVIEGKSGIILDYDKPGHDLERGADWMVELLTDEEKYRAMVASTMEAATFHNLREFTTAENTIRWLRIFSRLLTGLPADKVWLVREMVQQRTMKQDSAPALGSVAVVN